MDAAGNVGSYWDKSFGFPLTTPPVQQPGGLSAAITPPPNADGFVTNGTATVVLSGADAGTAIEYSLDGADPQPYPASGIPVTGEGTHRIDASAADRSQLTVYVRIDSQGPTITVTTPSDGGAYWLHQNVDTTFRCDDAGVVTSCSGLSKLDTSTLGSHTFTVNATDSLGHETRKEVHYTVVRRPIVFASARTGYGDVYMVDPAGGTPTQLTSGNHIDAEPEWFPAGDRVLFSSSRTGNGDIYALALGGGLDRLTSHTASDTSPAVSPDGARITFASNRSGNWDIWVMNADGSGVAQLTTHSKADLLPAWGPGGRYIAFMSQRSGDGDIYKMNANGTGQTRLTSSSNVDAEPAWSPDGGKIAFSTNRHGSSNFELYTMNTSGGALQRLTVQAGHDVTPTWSADGAFLAFASNRSPGGGGNFNVYKMPAAPNSGATSVVLDPAADVFPDW